MHEMPQKIKEFGVDKNEDTYMKDKKEDFRIKIIKSIINIIEKEHISKDLNEPVFLGRIDGFVNVYIKNEKAKVENTSDYSFIIIGESTQSIIHRLKHNLKVIEEK